jgi:eukaryotic-like serine/threonine-protein kinase
VAGGSPGDDDRATVDLGPRALIGHAGVDDLGPDDGDTEGDELGQEHAADAAGEANALDTRTIKPDASIHQLDTHPLARKRSPTDSQTKYSTNSASPTEAMRMEEIARAQVFLRIVVVTSIAGLIAALATRGDRVAELVQLSGCMLTLAGALWMWHAVDPARYSAKEMVGPALVISFGAFGGVYYWGCASPVAAMITYGIYFFSLGANTLLTTSMYVLVAILHALFGVAIMTGTVLDRGVVTMPLGAFDDFVIILVIEFLYFITFFTARVSQRVTLDHVSRLEKAVRGVTQREALLAEARAELDRALKVGGPGRFSDQQVGGFRLGLLIGRGGMGEVYEAKRVDDGGEAAVKLLHPGTLGEPTHVARFVREAEAAGRLDSPHVVRVLEVGTTAGEVPFLAMERLRGRDLAHHLRRKRRLELAEASELAEHVAAGLEAARAAGIVHRDLKPHNVFLAAKERRWKILDFGVSKVGGTGTLTRGHVIGTPAYMAPEQARGEDVDHRADVYSLAAILYRAVTGHPAFTGKDVPATLYDVVFRVPTQPSILAPLPADVDRVLALGLAKEPRDRFETASELAAWFARAVRDELVPEQRRRADDVANRQPWGTRHVKS